MVYCESAQWKAAAPQIRMEITITAETGNNATYKWELYYVASSPAKTVASRPYTATIDGKQVASGNYDINNVTGKKLITSGTVTLAKQSSSRWWPFGCTMDMGITWSGVYKGVVSASNTVGIRAITTYTISYNANGGSGAPSSQTKTHGTNLKLSTSIPNRAGYIFAGWSSTSTGAVKWSAGGTYSTDSNATLYAVWTPSSYTIIYDANGGTGQPANQTKSHGVNLTLSSTVPTKTGYKFLGWSLSYNATAATWSAGGTYTQNASNILYAVWESSYVLPRVNGLKIARTDADGNFMDDGSYMGVEFNYQCSQPSTNVVIEWRSGQENGSETFALSGGLTGEFLQFIGEGTFDPERTYDITIIVSDTFGSTTLRRTLSGVSYPIDVKAGGTGIAFGKPAETDDLLDCNYNASFRKSVSVKGCEVRAKRCVVGNNTGTSTYPWFKFASTNIGYTGDRNMVFRVMYSFGGESQSAILNVLARHDKASETFTNIKFYVESGNIINPWYFRLLYGPTDLELWVYCKQWRTCRVEVLNEGDGTTERFDDWTLYNVLGDEGVESPTPGFTAVEPTTYLDTIYPINSIYISYSHTSPASLFGGTWVRITESFLWATSSGGTIGQTGGESKHTLTINEIPSHSHLTGIQDGKAMSYTTGGQSAVVLFNQTTGLATNPTGGGQAHNNMPPYTQVSIWRRIDPNDAVG